MRELPEHRRERSRQGRGWLLSLPLSRRGDSLGQEMPWCPPRADARPRCPASPLPTRLSKPPTSSSSPTLLPDNIPATELRGGRAGKGSLPAAPANRVPDSPLPETSTRIK